jgi:hypothetical protein
VELLFTQFLEGFAGLDTMVDFAGTAFVSRERARWNEL